MFVFVLMAWPIVSPAPRALALVRLDFEQKYFQHPGRQVWDFSIIRPDSVYHIYYHTILESTPNSVEADTLWHATSVDLKHWNLEGPILTIGPNTWDEGAVWAPDVFRDDANDRWGIAYTGCDASFNQRTCLAFSDDLYSWTKAAYNPAVVPDTDIYIWNPNGGWGNFRDPFVYRQDDRWHLLVTAKQDLGTATGVLYHGTSTDLINWQDEGYIFANDGNDPWRVLESPQYHVIGDFHHLFFGEFDTPGISLVSARNPADWTMANRLLLDYGYAPEVDSFDPGHRIFSRLAPYEQPGGNSLAYVVRCDTLLVAADGSDPAVHKPHPLGENWAIHSGLSNLGNPVFQDNPLWRGEPSVGLIGHGYYSSKEYYQGPLSGRGSPGTQLGDAATGVLESFPFTVAGQRMDLLVGGGNYPTTCFVALVDLADDTILYAETGQDSALMSLRQWDLVPFQGRECVLRIVDSENGPFGYINVDEIVERLDHHPPSAPTSLVASYFYVGVYLDWDEAAETDFLIHRVYRSSEPGFVPDQGNLLGETTVSAWSDITPSPWNYFYQVTTVDDLGNESMPAAPGSVSGLPLPEARPGLHLAEAAPNPFNPLTRLDFEIDGPGQVTLRIYDTAGRLVQTLVDETLPSGHHTAMWDGRDARGQAASAGIYLYRLESSGASLTRRMTLLK